MSEEEKCPECGGQMIFVPEAGEVACSRCGLVQSVEENVVPGWMGDQSEPYSGISKAARIPMKALVSMPEERRRPLSRVGRLSSTESSINKIQKEIDAMAATLGVFRKEVLKEANAYAAVLKKSMPKLNMRMSGREIAAVSVWRAAQIHGIPILYDEFERFYPDLARKIYKLLSRSAAASDRVVKPPRAIEYIKKLIGRISDFPDKEYVSAVENYAVNIIKIAEALGLLKGKDPAAAAGTAIHVADEKLGSRMSRKVLDLLGIKFNDRLAKDFREISVPSSNVILSKKVERMMREILYSTYKRLNGRVRIEAD